jgi:hypothetical protein
LRVTALLFITPEEHLNEVYVTVLQHPVSPDYTNEERKETYDSLEIFLEV